jgi:chemotaxis protein methyltransferase CheR
VENTASWEWFIKKFEGMSKIDLNAYKRPQMERRINSFMRSVNSGDYANFISILSSDRGIYRKFIEHLTINVSEFFRNPNQWAVLEREVIPELLKHSNSLKVWSAGCSTGEEAYSLAMLFREKFNCTAPHFVNTVRQHFVEYFVGNIQPGLHIPELNEYGCCYRNLYKPL